MSATMTKAAPSGNAYPRTIPLLCKHTGMELECLELIPGAMYRISVFFGERAVSAMLDIAKPPDSAIGMVRLWMHFHAASGMPEYLLGKHLCDHIKTML